MLPNHSFGVKGFLVLGLVYFLFWRSSSKSNFSKYSLKKGLPVLSFLRINFSISSAPFILEALVFKFSINSKRLLSWNFLWGVALTKSFLVLAIKTNYKEIKTDSNEYEKYEAKARLNLINKIYQSHDNNLNEKYKVELNKRTIDRVKNSF